MPDQSANEKELRRLREENAQLKEREANFRALNDRIGDVFYLNDLVRDAYIFIEGRAEKILGIPSHKLKPSDWNGISDYARMIDTCEDMSVRDAAIKLHNGDLSFWQAEYRVHAKDGATRWVRDESIPLRNADGQFWASYGRLIDITDVRETQEQLLQAQKMEALGRLAGTVAHDFNNLLTAIIGFADLIVEEDGLNQQALDFAALIKVAGLRSAALVRQMLTFARRQRTVPTVIGVNQIIRESEPILQQLIGPGITLDINLEPNLWHAKADATGIQQALVNLSVNGRDAMPSGGTLSISTRNVAISGPRPSGITAGDYSVLSVGDTGVGMDDEMRARIFEPFFTTKPVGQGTGLGLSTCLSIVQQSGGFIQFESKPGKGSLFEIYLPRVDEPIAPAALITYSAWSGDGAIAIISEDEFVRQVAAHALGESGYQIMTFVSLAEAQADVKLADHQARLLIVDIDMPGIDDSELIEKTLRIADGIALLTLSGVRAGISGWPLLAKPFTAFQLRSKVREMIAQDKSNSPV